MIYLFYLLLVPIELALTLAALILAPILPIFAKDIYGLVDNGSSSGTEPRLPDWLGWFQTWDNSLYGDATFQRINGESYLSMVKWLIRNPLPCFAQKICTDPTYTISGNNAVTDGAQGVSGCVFVKSNGLFQFVWIFPISASKCVYINIGWNIRALTMGASVPFRATFSFSPRISAF